MNYRPAIRPAAAPLLALVACALLWACPALASHKHKAHAKSASKSSAKKPAKAPAPVDPRLDGDRARCQLEHPQQELAACVRETQAARADERRGLLGIGDVVHADNALRRCDPLPAEARSDCLARARGQGTVSGSVQGGGVLRELKTPAR